MSLEQTATDTHLRPTEWEADGTSMYITNTSYEQTRMTFPLRIPYPMHWCGATTFGA
jgi:hypothetical protein